MPQDEPRSASEDHRGVHPGEPLLPDRPWAGGSPGAMKDRQVAGRIPHLGEWEHRDPLMAAGGGAEVEEESACPTVIPARFPASAAG